MSCETQHRDSTIVSKSYSTYTGYPLPKGICRFVYDNYGHEFQDSCHFYQVGDTIKFQ